MSDNSFNFDDLKLEDEFRQQHEALRKRNRVKKMIAGGAAGLMLTIGFGYYISDARANIGSNAGSGQSGPVCSAASAGVAGGGCCGGRSVAGASGASGAGAALGSTSLADLEKQGLAEYKKENRAADVKAKATDFGCHIQIDISDKTGKVVRSYGFQGGPLYVIQ